MTPDAAVLDRFVDKILVDDGCWEWTAARSGQGYGYFTVPTRQAVLAHRFAYEWLVGPIPDGLTIDHLCRNRGCVNPAHLEPVTNKENVLRGEGISARNATKTHCVNGHRFDEANTYVDRGKRGCKQCRAERDSRRNDIRRFIRQFGKLKRPSQ